MLDKLYITPKQWLHILRWTLYTLLFLLAMMLQTVVFGNKGIFGAQPHFVPVVITAVCLREGPERGGTFALLSSLLWCLSGADHGSVSVVVLTVLPVLGCLLSRAVLMNRYLPCLLLTFVTLLTEQSIIFLMLAFFSGLPGELYVTSLLPCVLVSMAAQPLVYVTVRGIEKIGDAYES